uniref:Uncharacterized protein n=5 Tax=Timema TaxID=61471 RepID=A0A7R9K0J1_TIMGE|nr:unnamed protein product [Timema douglasi]CAD7259452.1 unnamed protein product [Timema shepardi]CAD7410807.1 unnamed protein product [Timema cristinae]CAD7574218.1 unnamed protein product [Timema californicum]CAD7597266.1 unnamed protein product [Timema genevievae]
MGKSKTGLTATAFTILAFLFVFIAFVTPYWLETDGRLERPKFIRIGLWQVCFDEFEDTRHWYDTKFSGCWWVFEEEYYIIHDILLPGFFVATQFFFTLTFTLLLIASFLVALYMCCSRQHERFVLLLWVVGADLIIAAISGTIAVIVFGARGDGRDWMANWEHNNISWSYALAVLGVLFLYVGGILFAVEGRVHNKKRERALSNTQAQAYQLEQRKGHTVI